MAQKVKVQCWGPVCYWKSGWWWISNRSGWLLKLLTELIMTTSFWTLSRLWFHIWSHLLLIISIWWICKLTFPFLTGLLPTTMNGSGFSIAEKGYLQRIRKDHVRLWCITLKDWIICNPQNSPWFSQKEKIDNACFQLLNHSAPHPYQNVQIYLI